MEGMEKIEQKGSLEALKIKEQWGSQVKILSKLGILETFPDSKQLGIRGIDGKEYPVPKPEEITEMLEANREMVLGKWNRDSPSSSLSHLHILLTLCRRNTRERF